MLCLFAEKDRVCLESFVRGSNFEDRFVNMDELTPEGERISYTDTAAEIKL